MLRDFIGELARAGRALSRAPGYSGIAVLTLGLGIGANVAIFTVVDSVLLQPLAYPESDRIVQIKHHAPGLDLPDLESSHGLIDLYRQSARTFSSLVAIATDQVNLTGLDRPARVRVIAAEPTFFDVFGTRPMAGRAFTDEDAAEGAAPVAILMYDAWQSRFGADPAAVGQRIELDGESAEIIGIMPAGFTYGDPETVALVPYRLDPTHPFGTFGTTAIAKLAPGVDRESAGREISALQARIPENWPDVPQQFLDGAGWSASVNRLLDLMVEDIERALWVLLATVGLVLLIAGANVANLFLVRAESRQREVAIRSALGANRQRLTSSFLAESLLLGLGGGAVGTLLALAGVRLLILTGPERLPRLHEIGMDGTALAFGAALSVLAGVLLGLIPMIRFTSDRTAGTLREGGRGATAGRQRQRARQLLIASQVAMALVLLVASGLMLRSVARLRSVDPGIRPDGVLSVGVSRGNEGDRAAAIVFYDRVLEEINGIPGVEMAGAVNAVPLDPQNVNGGSFHVESRPRADDELPPVSMYSAITPGWFEAVGVDLVEGRFPESRDHQGGPPVLWISQAFASQFFPDGAIGERISFGGDSTFAEIVGIVGDVRTFGLREEIRPMAYLPMTTNASASLSVMSFAVRTRGDAASVLPAVRQAIARVDPDVPLTTARTMDEIVSASMADTSFTTALLAIAAIVALLLGTVGIYGVISYTVAQRTQEMGVRIALGARPADVRTMVVRQGLAVTLAGVAVGLVAGIGATSLLASLLFEVSARDPWVFIGVSALLIGVGLLAVWLPARRAAAVDPMIAMRTE